MGSIGMAHQFSGTLIHPTVDLPDGLDDHNTTQFIVTTNEADPLCEEGKHLVVEMQKRGANV
jgi:hypothetical protein